MHTKILSRNHLGSKSVTSLRTYCHNNMEKEVNGNGAGLCQNFGLQFYWCSLLRFYYQRRDLIIYKFAILCRILLYVENVKILTIDAYSRYMGKMVHDVLNFL